MKVVTAQDMYDLLLAKLNKEENGSVAIPEAEILFNEQQLVYLSARAEAYERSQKRIDDLRTVKRVATLLPTSPTRNEFDFENANVSASGPLVNYTDPNGRYGYFRATRVEVEFNYKNNPCFPDGVPSVDSLDNVDDDDQVDWIICKIMKSDKDLTGDYYNEPTDERPYYDFLSDSNSGSIFKIINKTPSRANRVRMEYLVHPSDIVLTGPAATDPNAIDLPIHARREVVTLAAISKLEEIESKRVQSAVQVEALTPE